MKTQNLMAAATLLCLATPCEAQLQNVTVQLPTFHVTSVSTTVSVPVGGSMVIGGVGRSSFGRHQFGPTLPGLGNRGLRRHSGPANFTLHATLHDFDAMDRALLAEAARRRGAKFDVRGRPVAAAPKALRDLIDQRWRAGVR